MINITFEKPSKKLEVRQLIELPNNIGFLAKLHEKFENKNLFYKRGGHVTGIDIVFNTSDRDCMFYEYEEVDLNIQVITKD